MGEPPVLAYSYWRQICVSVYLPAIRGTKNQTFATLDKEWLEFVKLNRTVGDIQHHYDVVIGPVADDNTMETVQLYLSGILSVDEAVTRLRYNKVNNQVSFTPHLLLNIWYWNLERMCKTWKVNIFLTEKIFQ